MNFKQVAFDILQFDPISVKLDLIVNPPAIVEHAVYNVSLITGSVESVFHAIYCCASEGFLVFFCIVPISNTHGIANNDNLAFFPIDHRIAVFI